MSYSLTVNYDSAAALSFNSTLVEVASSTLRLKDQGGGTYTTTPQLITSQRLDAITALTSFAESSTTPANTAVQYQLVLNGVSCYWNSVTALWAVATNGFTTSNTAATINSHASTLFSDLALLVPQYLGLRVYLSTTAVGSRPVLTSNTVGYSWADSAKTVMNQCAISAYLSDLVGNIPTYVAATPVNLLISCDRSFFHGNNFVEPFTKSFAFDSSGHCSASVIETATPGVKLKFAITFQDGNSTYSQALFSAIVPNQSSIDLTNLTSAYPVNFG